MQLTTNKIIKMAVITALATPLSAYAGGIVYKDGDKYFKVAFVFGDKAVKAIEESDLPPALIREVKGAKRYMEGRVLRIEVKKKEQINAVIKLTAIKVNN